MLKVTLFVLAVLSGAQASQLDSIFDEVLYEASQNIIKKGLDRIALPHFDKGFSEKIIGPITISGDVFIQNGQFTNLSTIYRVEPVGYENKTDGTMIFTLTLGMKEVELRTDFGYKVMFFSSHKTVDAQCTENAITIQMSLYYDEKKNCKVTLNKASIDKLGGFIIHVTPSGILSNLESKLLTFGINKLADISKSFINQNLVGVLNNVINNVDICGMLPF